MFIGAGDLAGLLAEHQPGRTLAGVTRLTGGSKKGVYRLTFDDGPTVILYAWNPDENYWPASGDPLDDPFSDASGPDLFETSQAALDAAGARPPRLYAFDRTGRHHPADLALVEDVRGGSLETLLDRDSAAAAGPLAVLGASLRAMHATRSPYFGKLAFIDRGIAPQDRRAEDVVVDRALRHLATVAARDPRVAAARHDIEALVRTKRAAVAPRREYGLVHGELGADHVLLDDDGRPVIIDIEGLTYFDVEWEHAFLRLRFGAHYSRLGLPEVDEDRVDLYAFAQSLSLIEGPLRIADTDFPDREWMLNLAEWNIGRVLTAVAGRGGPGR
ncbi:MAG: aminoglycoside phosphotransferase family protein [Actinocatenispora sp.]